MMYGILIKKGEIWFRETQKQDFIDTKRLFKAKGLEFRDKILTEKEWKENYETANICNSGYDGRIPCPDDRS